MDKFDLLYDSAFNLIKAAEENQKQVDNALKLLKESSIDLTKTINSINSQFKTELKSASEIASKKIIDVVSSDLKEAKDNAIEAARIYKKNARYSILKLSCICFIFFLTASASIWYFFIKDIPKIDELYQRIHEQERLNENYKKLLQYGDIEIHGKNKSIYIKVIKSKCYTKRDDGDYCEVIFK